jgi:hypothetical protein
MISHNHRQPKSRQSRSLRQNLEAPANPATGWFVTRTPSAYIGIYIPDSRVRMIDDEGQVVTSSGAMNGAVAELRLDSELGATEGDAAGAGIWTPVAIQAVSSSRTTFEGFKSDLVARASWSYSYNATTDTPTGTLTFTSRHGEVLAMSTQKRTATLPSIDGQVVSPSPLDGQGAQIAFDSPFLSMTRGSGTAVVAGPLGMSGQTVNLDLTYDG